MIKKSTLIHTWKDLPIGLSTPRGRSKAGKFGWPTKTCLDNLVSGKEEGRGHNSPTQKVVHMMDMDLREMGWGRHSLRELWTCKNTKGCCGKITTRLSCVGNSKDICKYMPREHLLDPMPTCHE